MKRFKLVVPSFIALIFCMLLIAGSTFALFTSKASASVAVTSGKVKVTANLELTDTYSAQVDANGTLEDENGAKYEYAQQTKGNFVNGGTASVANNVLTIDRMVPGDKAVLSLTGANESNVNIKYRVTIEALSTSDNELLSVMNISLTNSDLFGNEVKLISGLKKYQSAWMDRPAPAANADNIADTTIEIVLPLNVASSEANNFKYEEKTVSYKITLEAVQGNAATSGAETIEKVYIPAEASATVTPTIINDQASFEDKVVAASVQDSNVTVTTTVPKEVLKDAYDNDTDPQKSDVSVELVVSDLTVSKDTDNVMNLSVELSLLVNNVEVENAAAPVPVEIFVGQGVYVESVTHKGNPVTFQYDHTTGIVSFETNSFSPFQLSYSVGKQVSDFEELQEALTHKGVEVQLANDIQFPAGCETLTLAEGVTLNGSNHKITTAKETYSSGYPFVINGKDVTIKNLDVDAKETTIMHNLGALINVNKQANFKMQSVNLTGTTSIYRAMYYVAKDTTLDHVTGNGFWAFIYQSNGGDELEGKLHISDSTINSLAYTINFGGSSANVNVLVEDSQLNGWTSYSLNSGASITFKNVEFNYGLYNVYNYMRPYNDVTFIGCTFGNGFMFGAGQAGKTYTFTNCSGLDSISFDTDDNAKLETVSFIIDGENNHYDSETGKLVSLRKIAQAHGATNIEVNEEDGYAMGVIDNVQYVFEYDDITLYNTASYTGTTLEIPAFVTILGGGSLSYNNTITKLIITHDLKSATKPLQGNNTCKTIELAEGVTLLNDRLVYRSYVEEIILPDTLKTIENSALKESYVLKEVIVPASVETIGQEVFRDSTSLEKIVFLGSPAINQYYIGRTCNKLKEVWFCGENTTFTGDGKPQTFTFADSNNYNDFTIYFVNEALRDLFVSKSAALTGVSLEIAVYSE